MTKKRSATPTDEKEEPNAKKQQRTKQRETIKHWIKRLKKLPFEKWKNHHYPRGRGEVESFMRAFAHDDTVKKLELSSHNDFCPLDLNDETGVLLATALQTNTTLTQLNAFASWVGPKTAQAFAEMLKVNKTIKVLNLYNNPISDQGCKAIAKVLASGENTTLREIYFHDSNFTDDACLAFVDVLKANRPNLRKITVSGRYGNHLKPATKITILEALQSNTVVRECDISFSAEGKAYYEGVHAVLVRNAHIARKLEIMGALFCPLEEQDMPLPPVLGPDFFRDYEHFEPYLLTRVVMPFLF